MSHTPGTGRITPTDWATDLLGKFLDDAHHNTVASFANLRPQYDSLSAIDQLYAQMINNLNRHPEFVTGLFLIRAHSSFRAAVRLCLSGQLAEAYMVLRGSLESALYGLFIASDTNRQMTWLRRHEDDASRQRVQTEFTIRNILAHLQLIDNKTHDIAKALYGTTIDYGGHPNERAITTQIKIESTGSRAEFTAEYFVCGGVAHQLSLKVAGRIGICNLDIFSHVFRHRYMLLGIDYQLDQIRQGF